MATKKLAYNPTTKVATVLLSATALPSGSVDIGTFTHPDGDDHLSRSARSHVLFHHIQEMVYKRYGEQDMKSVTIVDNTSVLVTGLTVAPTTVKIEVGKTQQLIPTVTPTGADNQNVTYNSDNTDVAMVSRTGLITGYAVGKTQVNVRTVDGSGKLVSVPVEVINPVPPA